MWTIIFFTSWQCSWFVMGNDDWLSHVSDESQPKCEKSPSKSSKNEKIIFILRSTSDDWPSDPSNKSHLKCKKRPPKSSKNEMLIFGLCSTSDDQPSDLSDEIQLKCEKGPISHRTMKCSFLDYIQLLMISWVIQAKNVDRNAKKGKRPPKSLKNQMFIFGLCSTCDDRPSDLSKKHWPKCKKMEKAP